MVFVKHVDISHLVHIFTEIEIKGRIEFYLLKTVDGDSESVIVELKSQSNK